MYLYKCVYAIYMHYNSNTVRSSGFLMTYFAIKAKEEIKFFLKFMIIISKQINILNKVVLEFCISLYFLSSNLINHFKK